MDGNDYRKLFCLYFLCFKSELKWNSQSTSVAIFKNLHTLYKPGYTQQTHDPLNMKKTTIVEEN